MSAARALSAVISFSSSGVFTEPFFTSMRLRMSLNALANAHFLAILLLKGVCVGVEGPASVSIFDGSNPLFSSLFFSRNLLTLSCICWRIFPFFSLADICSCCLSLLQFVWCAFCLVTGACCFRVTRSLTCFIFFPNFLHNMLCTLWQAKCSNIQFVQFYIQFCIIYSTCFLTFNTLFNIQLFTQHSTIHLTFNYSLNIQLFIQHLTIYLTFSSSSNYSFNIQLSIQFNFLEPSVFLVSVNISAHT